MLCFNDIWFILIFFFFTRYKQTAFLHRTPIRVLYRNGKKKQNYLFIFILLKISIYNGLVISPPKFTNDALSNIKYFNIKISLRKNISINHNFMIKIIIIINNKSALNYIW